MEEEHHDPTWPEKVTPHIGQAVRGEMRFPRAELEAEFDSALTRTNGGMLFGLRRTGKSSEAVACAERLRKLGKKVIEEDAQGKTSEAELLCAILGQLQVQGIGGRLLRFISGDSAIPAGVREAIKLLTPSNIGDVQAYFGPIAAAIQRALAAHDEKPVLIVDELPWLCRSILQADSQTGRRRVDVLLAALRGWRAAGMRMLLMGSIGLVGLGREYKLDLSHLNDLTPLSVPPLEPEEAEALVRALAAGGNISGWSEEHTQALLTESVAFYPSILQRGFLQVTIGGKATAVKRFEDIFARKVRPELDDAFFKQFDNRVQRYGILDAPLPQLLEHVLEAVLVAPAPVSRSELKTRAGDAVDESDLTDALSILKEDGFVTPRIARSGPQTWSAASTLVTAWRNQRRGGAPA
ncbi:MAG: hypothetical protein FJ147_17900 [Deltaproteobacteria bacterium]|nr:hypothetical protein [Deltaproteobacteria bacterium]